LDEPRPYSEQEEAARMHLGHCTECREFFERDAALARAIARYGTAAKVPENLRKRIREALFGRAEAPQAERLLLSALEPESGDGRAARVAGEIIRATRLPVRLRREGWALAAAVLAFLAAAVFLHPGAPGVGEAYARDYLSHVEDIQIYSPDPGTVSRFFQQQMGIGVHPVMLDEGRLTRAMVCLLADRQAAMVEYALGDHVVAHYRIVRRQEVSPEDARMRASSERGVTIVTWQDPTFEHALVGDLPAADLITLARAAFTDR
jgi:hypothetical protein